MELIYELLSYVEEHKSLKDSFSEYVKKCGLLIVKNPEKDNNMVELLLDLREKFLQIVEKGFFADQQFGTALKVIFCCFVCLLAGIIIC